MIDVVKIFSDAATAKGFEFAYGKKDILNWETTNKTLSGGKTVLMVFPFTENARIDNGIIHEWSASTILWLGKKFDTSSLTGTFAQLDETEKQKYDRRLNVMRSTMETLLKYIFCGEDLELTAAVVAREINQFDENLDFVAAEINFLADDS